MDQMLLHPKTKLKIKNYVSRPSHALIITGQAGSGKKTLAENLAVKLLNLKDRAALEVYPYFSRLRRPADKQDISIDAVRHLIRQLKLRTTGQAYIRRVVIIEAAEDMSIEAQNALLKILEEPASDTTFILTTSSYRALLPTIMSRAQLIDVQPVTAVAAHSYFGDRVPGSSIEQAWLLSGGATGLLSALLADEEPHPLRTAINDVKSWLRQDRYQRLMSLDKLSRNKDDFKLFLLALDKVLRALQYQQIAKDKPRSAAQILRSRRQVDDVRQALEDNGLPRLAALRLLISLEL